MWNLNWNSYIFIHENPFENVVWKMPRPQCVMTQFYLGRSDYISKFTSCVLYDTMLYILCLQILFHLSFFYQYIDYEPYIIAKYVRRVSCAYRSYCWTHISQYIHTYTWIKPRAWRYPDPHGSISWVPCEVADIALQLAIHMIKYIIYIYIYIYIYGGSWLK